MAVIRVLQSVAGPHGMPGSTRVADGPEDISRKMPKEYQNTICNLVRNRYAARGFFWNAAGSFRV